MKFNPIIAALVISTATAATVAPGADGEVDVVEVIAEETALLEEEVKRLQDLNLAERFDVPEVTTEIDYNGDEDLLADEMVATAGHVEEEDMAETAPTVHESEHQHNKSARARAKAEKERSKAEKTHMSIPSKATKDSHSMSQPVEKEGKSSKRGKGSKSHSISMSHPAGKASKVSSISMSHPGKADKDEAPDAKAYKGKGGKRGKRQGHSMSYPSKAEKMTGTGSTTPMAMEQEPTEPVDIVVFTEAPETENATEIAVENATEAQPITRAQPSGVDTKELQGVKLQQEVADIMMGEKHSHTHHTKKENVGALEMGEGRLSSSRASEADVTSSGARYGVLVGGVCLVLSAVGFAISA